MKQQLTTALTDWMVEHHLKQTEAAVVLRSSRPRLSDVVNQKTAKCSTDTARRDINELLALGALRKLPGGGRSAGYDWVSDPPTTVPQPHDVGA